MSDYTPADAFDGGRQSHLSPKAEARRFRKASKVAKTTQSYVPLTPKTERQAELITLLNDGEDVFAVGGAGTGKTYIPSRIAARALVEGKIGKIIICRVTVTSTRHALGFLPGKLDQKLAPWLVPVIEGIRAEVSSQTFEQWKLEGRVEFVSFEHMRGRTFSNCFVLLDEAQNATYSDLRLFLTRIGEGAQVVITGDGDQVDIPNSGLEDILDLVEDYDVPMAIVEFEPEDVVRSKLAKAWVMAFDRDKGSTLH